MRPLFSFWCNLMIVRVLLAASLLSWPVVAAARQPAQGDERLQAIAAAPSAANIKSDITRLVGFGTRHTFSETESDSRGIGAARRWIESEFERISADCDGCLEVSTQRHRRRSGERRVPHDAWVVNVLAVQRGAPDSNTFVLMSGDIDSRVSDVMDYRSDSPGANDNASGVAGVLEAARVLSGHRFRHHIIYAALSGEEQGLYGGASLARHIKEQGWNLIAVLNNDMIGNISGIDGVVDNRSFRIFSEPVPVTETEEQRRRRRFTGGEVDGPSRQLARYIHRLSRQYLPHLAPMMIYRLDRYGRGGHHRPFNDMGFAGVRIMEAHEHYDRQHQDLRRENGTDYGDTIDGVDFDYAANLTAVNAVTLASLAWAPPAPEQVRIEGAVQPAARLSWRIADDETLAGYKIYWRETTAPQWQGSRWVGRVDSALMEGMVIDNYYFGVAAVSAGGHESPVVFPQ